MKEAAQRKKRCKETQGNEIKCRRTNLTQRSWMAGFSGNPSASEGLPPRRLRTLSSYLLILMIKGAAASGEPWTYWCSKKMIESVCKEVERTRIHHPSSCHFTLGPPRKDSVAARKKEVGPTSICQRSFAWSRLQNRISLSSSYLLGLLAKIKCSICSNQLNLWFSMHSIVWDYSNFLAELWHTDACI